jgi:hypothetical protein
MVRALLLQIEESGKIHPDAASQPFIRGHVEMLDEAKLIEGRAPNSLKLTWAGREFADLVRSDDVWFAVVERIGRVGSAPFDVWCHLLAREIKERTEA